MIARNGTPLDRSRYEELLLHKDRAAWKEKVRKLNRW